MNILLRPIAFVAAGLFALSIFCLPFAVHAYSSPGKPTGLVNDFAGMLSASEKASLEDTLRAVQASTSNEIAVVTIPSLDGDYIENYAVQLFEEWKIGTAKNDNGVLLLIARDDREVRIEVGYGLEGALPDSIANSIIIHDITPNFKNGNYAAGITLATDDIIAATNGEYSAPTQSASTKIWGKIAENFAYIIFFGIFILQWIAAILGRSKSWWLGGVLGGIAATAIISFVASDVIFKILIFIVLVVFGLIFDFLVSTGYSSAASRGIKPPWWFGGGGGFGGHGGGGFGGFGGGGSGGGGASGRW